MIPAGSHHCGLLRIQKDKTLTQEAASRSWGHQNQSAHKNTQRGPDRAQLLARGGMGHQQHTSQDAWPRGAGAGVGPSPGQHQEGILPTLWLPWNSGHIPGNQWVCRLLCSKPPGSLLCFIDVHLIYNVVSVSGKHSDSVFLQIMVCYRLLQDTLWFPVLA